MTEVAEHPSAARASDPGLVSADYIVDRLLRKNEPHWESLSGADRRTVELVARTVASRLVAHLSALDAYATRRSSGFDSRPG
jgi:hypothetical protein